MGQRLRLTREFHRLNKLVFDGVLQPVPIRRVKLEPTVYAWCHGSHIQIAKHCPPELERAVLLHEMVHLWQFQFDPPMHHGRSFRRWRKTCFDRAGLLIVPPYS